MLLPISFRFVSEFSESYHLESSDQQDGLSLLRRAKLRGLAFPPRDGWVSVFPESEFGQDLEELSAVNTGVMLHHLYDEDAGWMFRIEVGGESVCYYECRWLDWGDPEERIKIKDDELDLGILEELARRHGLGGNIREELERTVHPRIVRIIDVDENGEPVAYDDFADWQVDENDWRRDEPDNVAFAFAELLRLPEYRGGWRHVKRHGKRVWLDAGGIEFRR